MDHESPEEIEYKADLCRTAKRNSKKSNAVICHFRTFPSGGLKNSHFRCWSIWKQKNCVCKRSP